VNEIIFVVPLRWFRIKIDGHTSDSQPMQIRSEQLALTSPLRQRGAQWAKAAVFPSNYY